MWLKDVFGASKPVIAMIHFSALPGAPFYSQSLQKTLERAVSDAKALQKGGVDGVLFSNEGDRPYSLNVGPETVASMASLVTKVSQELSVPFGVDVLWDPYATFAVAKATGATFARTLLIGAFSSDIGFIDVKCPEILRYVKKIGAEDVKRFVYLNPEFGSTLGNRTIEQAAKTVQFMDIAHVLCISGPATGLPITVEELKDAKKGAPELPVFINTGAKKTNIPELLPHAEGVVVGTSLKKDGLTWNPVEEKRVVEFMEVVEKHR
jgi:hypothetical protein